MARKYIHQLLISTLCFIFTLNLSGQEERILNYEVRIEVRKDRSLKVKEDLTVNVTGRVIKRGITRSLPRYQTMPNGKKQPIRYNITKVLRDGQKEGYHTDYEGGHEMMYIGRKEVFLRPGEYHYTIEYEVPNQVLQLQEVDEIYWNAIGNSVQFPVDQASCLVRLPDGVNHLQKACYTGRFGSTASNCTVKEFNNGNEIFFQTTQSLAPGEGLTVGVGFEKGAVAAPSFLEKYGSALLLGLSALGLLIYFVTTWNKYGIDPPKPTPYPQFASPKGYSPSSLSYIAKESYQSQKVTSSIINLAVNGYLRIDEKDSGGFLSSRKNYILTRLKSDYSDLYPEDAALMERLFARGSTVNIDGQYEKTVKSAYQAHQNSVLAQHEHFVKEGNNRQFLFLPIIISFLAVIGAVYMLNRNGTELDGLGLILFSAVFIGLPIFALISLFSSRAASISKVAKAFIIPFMFIFIFSGGLPMVMGLSELKGMILENFNGVGINIVALGLFVPLALISLFLYGYLIKKPTVEKLQLQSDIEGFKMYLEMAEKNRMNLLNPPDRTPEHFEAMLPYAFALGVEHKWSAIFKSILEKAAYTPTWSNNRHIYATNHFSSNFSRSVMSSATPPPSSSSGGSGGGGFSGGGGGGGGVGGW